MARDEGVLEEMVKTQKRLTWLALGYVPSLILIVILAAIVGSISMIAGWIFAGVVYFMVALWYHFQITEIANNIGEDEWGPVAASFVVPFAMWSMYNLNHRVNGMLAVQGIRVGLTGVNKDDFLKAIERRNENRKVINCPMCGDLVKNDWSNCPRCGEALEQSE